MKLHLSSIAIVCVAGTCGLARAQSCQWTPMGSGTGFATDCVVTDNGDMIAGLRIDFAGGAVTGFLSRWNGSTWTSVGGGVNDLIRVVELDTNGDVLVGGWFTHTTDGLLVNGLARWDGSQWHAYGPEFTPGVRFGYPEAILPLGNGELVVAGSFLQAGGTLPAGRVARWDGTAWQFMGALYTDNPGSTVISVQALAQLQDGSIVAGGNFRNADNGTVVNHIARWDGFAWQPMAGGVSPSASVQALVKLPSGDLIAGGTFGQAGGVAANRIARWDGFGWSPLGTGVAGNNGTTVYALSLTPDGDVLVGGIFATAGGLASNCVAKWSPASNTWSALGTGISQASVSTSVLGVAASADTYYVAGQFQDTLSVTNPVNVARFLPGGSLPTIDVQPTSITTCIGGSAVLSVQCDDPDVVGFQWQREASPGLWIDLEDRVIPIWGTISGTRTPTMTIEQVASGVPRTVRVLVSNPCRALPSQTVTLALASSCCDSIDINNDGSLFDPQDIEAFLSVYSEGPCIPASASCNDIDFNNDTSVFDPCDIGSFLMVYSEGPCTACGS